MIGDRFGYLSVQDESSGQSATILQKRFEFRVYLGFSEFSTKKTQQYTKIETYMLTKGTSRIPQTNLALLGET